MVGTDTVDGVDVEEEEEFLEWLVLLELTATQRKVFQNLLPVQFT